MSDSTPLKPRPDSSGESPPAGDVAIPSFGDDRHGEAYQLRRRGRKISDIADHFGVDVRTIHRWIREHHKAYSRTLEETPVVNLIAEEVAKLEEVEQTALWSADMTKHDAHRRAYLNLALKAMQARHHLLLEVGVLPREPTKIYSAVHELKPKSTTSDDRSGDRRTEDEMRHDVVKLLQQTRSL